MTLAATGSPGTVTISGDNGGTLILDSEGPPKGCYQKTNYRGEPHEWGAYGDAPYNDSMAPPHDDTVPLENWLGAYGNVGPGAPATAPASFGPWEATIPAIYGVSEPLFCPPNANLRAPANDSREGTPMPIVEIQASNGFSDPNLGTQGAVAVMTANTLCRISGLSINTNFIGGTYNPGATTPTYLDAVNIAGRGVVIDGHAIIEQGYYNVYCNGGNVAGLQLKDAQFNQSWSDNVHIEQCANVRVIGDVIALAGNINGNPVNWRAINLFDSGDDLTLADGMVEQAQGPNIELSTATHVSITGMTINQSGQGASVLGSTGAGIEIDSSKFVSICGNHFNANDQKSSATIRAHVRFGTGTNGPSQAISLCGNVYDYDSTNLMPNYVYDSTASGQATTNSSIFDTPQQQVTGVFTANALTTLLPTLQYSPGFPNNYLTGLILSNDATANKTVDISPGQAVDSTNASMIVLPPISGQPACTVNLANNGVGGLDTGSPATNTTYFYFVVALPGGGGANCMASTLTSPNFTAHAPGYALYRMIGALYTQTGGSTNVVKFVQSEDTFTLASSAPFGGSAPTGGAAISLTSVPSQISVQAFGRCAANAAVTLWAGNVAAQQAGSPFSTSPGYMVNLSTPNTPFPFSLYTTGTSGSPPGGTINAASASGTQLVTCYNDGWVFHRGR
jgi:hypothetical protein